MKKVGIVLFILQELIYPQSSWFWQNPLPQGFNLNDVMFLDENHIVAVGDASTFIKSNDGGLSWEVKINIGNTVHQINSVFFLDQQKGFAVAHDNSGDLYNGWLFRTSDGGDEWSIQTFNFNLNKILFVDDNNGWIVGSDFSGYNGRILRTTDGGVSWNTIFVASKELTDIKFLDPTNGWVIGNGIILKTTDGGENWIILNENSFYSKSLDFINLQKGFVIGNNLIMKTTDGGINWDQQYFDISLSLNSIKFINESTGFIACQSYSAYLSPVILITTDGGTNWIPTDSKNDLNSISIFNSNNLIAVGEGGAIIKSSDGFNWISLNKGDNSIYFYDIKFINENVGWSIGSSRNSDFDIIYKTSDAGITWFELYRNPINNFSYLSVLYFLNESLGWAAGADKILRTTDGGLTWDTQSITGYLHNICFYDSLKGIAVGTTILRSDDGGINWAKMDLPQNVERIYDVNFTGLNTAFIVGIGSGSDGYIYKTTDSGNNWNLKYTSGFRLNKIFMIDEINGWASGTSRQILKTTDGGENWSVYTLKGAEQIESIFFINKYTGWLIRYDGELIKTTDGGITWESLSIKYPVANDLYFVNENTGWICGDNGTILKTITGGTTSFERDFPFNLAKNFMLFQNYPNPFNPTTTIEYSIPERRYITLKIYDVLGREITTIINEEKPAGKYKIEFSGISLPSGVYFYQLKTNKFIESKRMILLK